LRTQRYQIPLFLIPTAVEYGNADWINPKLINGMKERKIVLVSNGLSDLEKVPSTVDVVTAPLAYIRLNGRNTEQWWGSDRHRRFAYLYNEKELKELADRIEIMAKEAKKIIVIFNNHPRGYAVKNAQILKKFYL